MGVHLNVFAHLVRNTVKTHGMPSARQAFVPTPLMNSSPAALRGYVEGDDPVHGRPFMAEVFDQLTRPVPADELRGESWDRSTPRYVEADGEEEMHALFQERRYTDFLPIVLPTEERVERMLAGTSHAAGRDGRQAPSDDRHGALALRRREGRRQRRDGRRRARALPGHPRARLERRHRAPEQHVLDGKHGRRQRADPARDRHEQRRRRARAVQLRELRDRARLRPALAEPPGRLGARARRTPARRAATSPTTASRSPRTRRRAPGSRTTCSTATTKDESAVTVSYIWGNVWAEYLRAHWEEKLSGDDLRPRARDGLHARARPDRGARVRRARASTRRRRSPSGSTRTPGSRSAASGTT